MIKITHFIEKDKQITAKVSFVFFVLAFFSLTFVPYFFPYDYYIVFLAFVFVAIIISALKFTLQIGIIPIILSVRIVYSLVNTMCKGIDVSLFIGQERVTFGAILVFLYAYNFIGKVKSEIRIAVALTSIASGIQVIYTAMTSGGDKNLIGSAIGMSNYVAAILLICTVYYCFIKKTPFEIALLVLDTVAFLITQSFGGYVAFLVLLIYLAITKVNWKSKLTYIIVSAFVICLPLIVLFSLKTGIGASFIHKILDKLAYLFSGNLNAFGSSRLELYGFSVKNIMKEPIFGIFINVDYNLPVDYRFQNFRTHNFVLESLLLYGIIGTILNGFLLYYIFKKGGKNPLKNPVKKICFFAIVLGVFHGLIEPTLFTFNYETFFWTAVGLFVRDEDKFGRTISFADTVASRI